MKRVADAPQHVINLSEQRSLQEKRSRTQLVVVPQSEVATVEIPDGCPILESVQSLVAQDDEGNEQIFQIQNAPTTAGATIIDQQEVKTESCDVDGSPSGQGVVLAQHMDITEPLTTLRTLLEQRLQISLEEYSFYLQDAQELDASKNLVNQCVQGEGLVQVNVELIDKGAIKKINIVDVLKPAEEVSLSTEAVICDQNLIGEPPVVRKVVIPVTEETEHVTRWIVSPEFKLEQERLKIPADPSQWKPNHVKHWIKWATGHFTLRGIVDSAWNIDGKQLVELTHADFMKKVPYDPSDMFWTHLELLRKCQIVAVVQPTYVQQFPQVFTTVTKSFSVKNKIKTQKIGAPRVAYEGCPGNRTGNNGQIQLWQFLLEMLTDKDSREYIQWIGIDGEFKLNNPEMVAQLWGQRKNKPTMNYEKLSRALRYYYDGDMIAKVHGKRFVYKFVCDLKSLLGYSAAELNRLVLECDQKKSDDLNSPMLQRCLREIRPAPSAEADL